MKLDPAKHAWMTATETRKLMVAPPSRAMANRNAGENFPVVAVMARDKIKKSESHHAD
jgi:hypothetical protein